MNHALDKIETDFDTARQNAPRTKPAIGTNRPWLKTLAVFGMLITDIATLLLIFWISLQIRLYILPRFADIFPAQIPPDLSAKVWWVILITIICIAYEKLYTRRLTFWRETKRLIAAVSLAFLLMLAAVSLTKMGGEVSRTVVVTAYGLSLIILPISRYAAKTLLARLKIWHEPVIIIGSDPVGREVAQALIKDRYVGYALVGFVDNNGQHAPVMVNGREIPLLGQVQDIAQILHQTRVKTAIIAIPHLPGGELVKLNNSLQPYLRSILIVPDLLGIPVIGGEVDYFFDEQILAFRTRNNLASRINIIAKRLFDISVGSIMLLVMLPLIIGLALAVRLDSKGTALYMGRRIGRHGREFRCYKFRTMFMNNDEILEEFLHDNPEALEEWQVYAKIKGDDPRVTRVGKWLRKFSLDELPQLINVLKGEMSLVGARPYLPREKENMGVYVDTILLANPGITGLWQVSGRNEIDFAGRLKMEAWYVRNWSMWLDISLLFRTVGVVLSRKGAY